MKNVKKLRLVCIGGIESTFENVGVLHEMGENIVGFYTRGEKSKGWEGVQMVDDSKYPWIKDVNRVIVQNNINDYTENIQNLNPDYIISLGWQQIYREPLLKSAKNGFIGIHESLLPKGAGAVPLANAILHGFDKTGITLFYLDGGMDTGDIIGQRVLPSSPRIATATQLYKEAMGLEKELLKTFIPLLKKGIAPRVHQDLSKRTEYGKILDWNAFPEEAVKRARTYPYG